VSEITKHYAYSGDRRIHYRRAGEGPPLLLIHASPGSSAALEATIKLLGERFTVIAPDTPGHGESSPLPEADPAIEDYAGALDGTLDALGLNRVLLAGAHTGAKIALEYSLRHPGRVEMLALDGLALYTDEERQSYLDHYLLDLVPQWDGTHLVTTWMMLRDMGIFWPWYERKAAARRPTPLARPDDLHANFVDFLRTEDYRKAYRAAFLYDTRSALARVNIPTLIVAAPSDPLYDHLGRIENVPESVTIDRVPEGSGQRKGLTDRISAFFAGSSLAATPPPAVDAVDTAVRRDYAPTRAGQVLARKAGTGSGRPLVLLHASPGSSAGFEPLALHFAADRPVVTFDNPGNGDSAAATGTPEIGDLADVLLDAIDTFGFEEFDIFGTHTGAMLGMDMALKQPRQVKRLILDGVTMYPPEKVAEILENYPIPMRVSSDGGHVLWAWNFLRDMQIWYPWYDKTPHGSRGAGVTPPEAIHATFREWIKGGKTYHLSYRAAFAYPTAEKLKLLDLPVLHCTSQTDPLRDFLPEATRITRGSQSRVHPGRATPEAAAVTLDLYRRFLAGEPLPDGLPEAKETAISAN
jgi:pimeloyl-ACP methyl ester carboxylesterase